MRRLVCRESALLAGADVIVICKHPETPRAGCSRKGSMSEATPSTLDTRREQTFPTLGKAMIERLCRFSEPRRFRKGEFLARAGAVPPGLLIVMSGEVHVAPHERPDDTIVTYHAGNFLGELAQLSGRPSLVDAVALSDV